MAKMSEEVNMESPLEMRQYNLQPPTLTLSTTVHSVTDRQTDDIIMPRADRTACSTACSTIG